MKKILKIVTISFAIIFALSSCETDETDNNTNDEYFVKYVIYGKGTYNYFNDFSVNTDKGTVKFSGYQYHGWNKTYGPVKKGFVAGATVKSNNVIIDIYVSKNNGPFSIKATKSGEPIGSTTTSLTYQIDF